MQNKVLLFGIILMINGITPAFSVRNTRILDWGKQVKLKLFLDLAVGQISTTVYDGQ